jgi:GT2 family glycosyltransferase
MRHNKLPKTPPQVSFVIPVQDDAVRLRRCLESISRDGFPADLVEVVVVDNGSEDGSGRVALEAGARVLTCSDVCVSELRNQGAAAARGEILAFIDADHEIAPGWTARAVENLGRPEVGAVGAPYLPPPSGTWVQNAFDAMRDHHPGLCEVEWLASGNLAVRRSDFDLVGGFDTTLESCEDFDLCQRLRSSGLQVMSDDRLRSIHFGDPATLRALFRAELWRGRDNLRAGLRGPITLRGLPSLMIPVLELGCLVAGCGGLFGAPSGLLLTAGAPVAIGALAALRASLMVSRRHGAGAGSGASSGAIAALQAFAVAYVYDLARALALVYRAPHHR